jgi:hypothetical protein
MYLGYPRLSQTTAHNFAGGIPVCKRGLSSILLLRYYPSMSVEGPRKDKKSQGGQSLCKHLNPGPPTYTPGDYVFDCDVPWLQFQFILLELIETTATGMEHNFLNATMSPK